MKQRTVIVGNIQFNNAVLDTGETAQRMKQVWLQAIEEIESGVHWHIMPSKDRIVINNLHMIVVNVGNNPEAMDNNWFYCSSVTSNVEETVEYKAVFSLYLTAMTETRARQQAIEEMKETVLHMLQDPEASQLDAILEIREVPKY